VAFGPTRAISQVRCCVGAARPDPDDRHVANASRGMRRRQNEWDRSPRCSPDHLQVVLAVKQQPQATSGHRVVIGEHDPKGERPPWRLTDVWPGGEMEPSWHHHPP